MRRFKTTAVMVAALSLCSASATAMPISDLVVPHPTGVVGQGSMQGAIPQIDGDIPDNSWPASLEKIVVDPIRLSGARVDDAIRLVLAGTGVAYSVLPGRNAFTASTVAIAGLRGPLPRVLNALSDSMGFFWEYRDGLLTVYPEKDTMLTLPPVADLLDDASKVATSLGATSVTVNKGSGAFQFRGNRTVTQAVAKYLQRAVADERQITYDISIVEVKLKEDNAAGINWENFQLGRIAGGPAINLQGGLARIAGGAGVGLSYASGAISMTGLLQFLNTQGSAQVVQHPKLTVRNGGSNVFEISTNKEYVSGLTTTAITGSTNTQSSTTKSVANTGITLKVQGKAQGNTTYTSVELEMDEMVELESVQVGADMVTNATTSRKKFVNQDMEITNGSTMLLAGINYDKRSTNKSEPKMGWLGKLFKSAKSGSERVEFVLLLTPHIHTKGEK